MGKSSSTPSSTSQTTKIELPGWYENSLIGARNRADRLFGLPPGQQPQMYPGALTVPFSEPSQQAFQQIQGLAANPQATGVPAAMAELQRTLGGNYLSENPGFTAALDAAQRDIVPRVQSAFNLANRSGGGLAQAAVAEEIADEFAKLYGDERTRMVSALSMAPQLSSLPYQGAQALLGVGGALEAKEGERVAEAAARHDFGETLEQRALDDYITRLGGIGPWAGKTQTGTTQSQMYSNPLSGALGGAMLGPALGQLSGGTAGYLGGGGLMSSLGLAAMPTWPIALGGALLGGLLS